MSIFIYTRTMPLSIYIYHSMYLQRELESDYIKSLNT